MSAPQLPHVILDEEWFRPDAVLDVVRRSSKSSTVPSQYSQATHAPSLKSAKSSLSSKPTPRNDVQHQPSTSDRHPVLPTEPAATPSMASIPVATPDNGFLGFCKGAWILQNGDQKGSVKRCTEADAWSRNASKGKRNNAQYLKCREAKCAFRSNFVSSDAHLIWETVSTFAKWGIKLRWPFLAKSHVPQRVVLNSKYAFRCLFCAYLSREESINVYNGMDLYLEHIGQEHRGQSLGDVIEYKTRCISNRIADDKELFDINIWPIPGHEKRKNLAWLSDELLGQRQTVRDGNRFAPPTTRPLENADPIVEDKSRATEQGIRNTHRESTYPLLTAGTLPQASQSFQYQPWEDIPAEIWGSSTKEDGVAQASLSKISNPYKTCGAPPTCSSLTSGMPSSPSYDLMAPPRRMSMHTGLGPTSFPRNSRVSINSCLNDIVGLFREASAVIDDTIKENPTLSHAPIVRLLAESIKEAPHEIEKERNRATLRFGEAFQYGDYTALCALQHIILQLRSGLLDQLHEGAYTRKFTNLAQLVDAVDSGRHATATALHDLKHRLVRSGCGAYQQPGPQSHPAYQPSSQLGQYGTSFQPMYVSGTQASEARHYISNQGGGHAEEASAESTASANNASVHVHFREEDITASARRRGSILSFFKQHTRAKSSNLLLDSKRKSDELAEQRMRVEYLQQRRKHDNERVRAGFGELGIAELDGRPVIRRIT